MGLRDTPLTTRSPPPGDAPRRIRNPPGCWRVQGPAGVWGPAARRHEANAEDGPVTGQGLGAAQRAETQLLVRSRSWAVPAARTPALGPPPTPIRRLRPGMGTYARHPLPEMRPSPLSPHLFPGCGPLRTGTSSLSLGPTLLPSRRTVALSWRLPRTSDLSWGLPPSMSALGWGPLPSVYALWRSILGWREHLQPSLPGLSQAGLPDFKGP